MTGKMVRIVCGAAIQRCDAPPTLTHPSHPHPTPRQSERDTKEEIAKVFALFDPDVHGRITFRELKRVVQELGETISDEEMREMVDEADRDHDGASAPLLSPPCRICHVCAPLCTTHATAAQPYAGFVTFDDFFRIMKKKSDNPLDDLDDDDE